MSKKRHIEKPPFGRKLGRCSWCGTEELPKGRRYWCSHECVDAYLIVRSPARVRELLLRRDHGICAICGCDADADYRAWGARRQEAARLADWLSGRMWPRLVPEVTHVERRRFREELAAKYAPGNWTTGRTSGWDADHIVPVVEGGGQCGLQNYRTLCHPCHKAETAKLARRRSTKRRDFVQSDLNLA